LAINVAAAVIGQLVVVVGGNRLARLVVDRPVVVAGVVLCLELLTLLAPGIDGVRRWLPLGALELHPAAIGEPVQLLAFAVLWQRRRTWLATALVGIGLVLHALQPDAGQATALAAGALALALFAGPRAWAQVAMVALSVGGAVLSWLIPDPLAPAEFVENIVPIAFELHPLMGWLAVVSFLALPAAALWRSGCLRRWILGREPHIALAAYLAAVVLVGLSGKFPTPVLGFGASPIIGVILGLGLLNPVRLALSQTPIARAGRAE
jgi:cell division protein FtsW (lipid II flippase)